MTKRREKKKNLTLLAVSRRIEYKLDFTIPASRDRWLHTADAACDDIGSGGSTKPRPPEVQARNLEFRWEFSIAWLEKKRVVYIQRFLFFFLFDGKDVIGVIAKIIHRLDGQNLRVTQMRWTRDIHWFQQRHHEPLGTVHTKMRRQTWHFPTVERGWASIHVSLRQLSYCGPENKGVRGEHIMNGVIQPSCALSSARL